MANDTKTLVASEELAEQKKRLDAAEAAIKAKDAELAALKAKLEAAKDSSNARPVRPGAEALRGEGYKFSVGPKKDHPKIKRREVECCDESEAIRWFILTTDDPDVPGKQIDPHKIPLDATCLDPRRAERIKRDKFIAGLRLKAERGATITPEEAMMLDEADKLLEPPIE